MRTRSASPRPACRATRTGGRRSRVAPGSSRACFDERERGYTVSPRAPVAQGIERCPAEAEVASSNLAGRMAQPSGVWRSDAAGFTSIRTSYSPFGSAGADESSAARARGEGVLGLADARAGGLAASQDGLQAVRCGLWGTSLTPPDRDG